MATTSELTAAIIGGFLGGALGVVSTLVGSYYGPRKYEEWRSERADAPKKRLLRVLLDDPRFPEGRYLETLQTVIEARGVITSGAGTREVWALIKNKPLDSQ
jgi:hypothetical protein